MADVKDLQTSAVTTTEDALKALGVTDLGQLLTQLNLSGQLSNLYVQPNYTDVNSPMVRDAAGLNQTLGTNLTYDFDAIKNIYQDATKASLAAANQSSAEKSYYKLLADAQNSAMDTMRKQYGSAVSSGATKGMQAANMLSTILGTTQSANEQATQLALDRQNRTNQYAQQLAQDTKDALQYSNDMQQSIASLSRQLYNDDIQRRTADLTYNQGINTDAAGVSANYTTALGNLLSNGITSATGVQNNNVSAISNLQAAIEQAKAQKYAAENAKQTITYAGGYTAKTS